MFFIYVWVKKCVKMCVNVYEIWNMKYWVRTHKTNGPYCLTRCFKFQLDAIRYKLQVTTYNRGCKKVQERFNEIGNDVG